MGQMGESLRVSNLWPSLIGKNLTPSCSRHVPQLYPLIWLSSIQLDKKNTLVNEALHSNKNSRRKATDFPVSVELNYPLPSPSPPLPYINKMSFVNESSNSNKNSRRGANNFTIFQLGYLIRFYNSSEINSLK